MWFISRWEKNYCLFRSQCIRIIDPYALWPFDKRLLICFPTCFNKEVKYLTLILKKDCSQLSFEVYNVFVAQKLKILGKVCNFVTNINDDCSQLSFEVYNVFVAQKLKILENLNNFFHAWTLATSATSRGPSFDLSDLNRISNFSWRYIPACI